MKPVTQKPVTQKSVAQMTASEIRAAARAIAKPEVTQQPSGSLIEAVGKNLGATLGRVQNAGSLINDTRRVVRQQYLNG